MRRGSDRPAVMVEWPATSLARSATYWRARSLRSGAVYRPSTVPEGWTHQRWMSAASSDDRVSANSVRYRLKSGKAMTLRYSGCLVRSLIAASTAWLYQWPA